MATTDLDTDIHSANYGGVHVQDLALKKDRKKKYTHPIFLYSGERDDSMKNLGQIVNVYKHSLEDFEFNARKIINHYVANYGNTSMGIYTLGQFIRFRVYEDQKPIDMSLFSFFINYTMLILPITMGADMHKWVPWNPTHFTNSGWVDRMNHYIRQCRPLGNMRAICECLEWTKFLTNLFIAKAGDRIGMSISNNEFLEVCNRSEFARELMNCEYPIPENLTPQQFEELNKTNTKKLLDIISSQTDLSIGTYARNGLFNPGQFREYAVQMGYKPDLYDHTIPMASNTNIIKGLKDPIAFMVDAYGGRKAEVLKLNVSDAGAFERSLSMLLSQVRYVDTDYECDSRHFRTVYVANLGTLDKLDGRVATMDQKSDRFFIISPDDAHLLGKTIYVKTPITCTHPDRDKGVICSACYGKMMAALNRDVHIGRLAGLNLADDMEQKLLSAKHALATNTQNVEFDELFYQYFDTTNCQISMNNNMREMSVTDPDAFNHLYLEFHLNLIKKHQDGEGRHYDRTIEEITVYDELEDERYAIREKNELPLYLTPEFTTDIYLPAYRRHSGDNNMRIPFSALIDTGRDTITSIFEYQYRNNGLSGPLFELQSIMSSGPRINAYPTYDALINVLIPLFNAGGIHLPDLQEELLISQLIFDHNNNSVDWTLEDPPYHFLSMDNAIFSSRSPLTSILYHEASAQFGGAYGTYKKSGTSQYDYFIAEI